MDNPLELQLLVQTKLNHSASGVNICLGQLKRNLVFRKYFQKNPILSKYTPKPHYNKGEFSKESHQKKTKPTVSYFC